MLRVLSLLFQFNKFSYFKKIEKMNPKLLYCLVIVVINHLQLSITEDVKENEIYVEDESNVLANAASEFLKSQNVDDLGGMLGDFIQSGGGKQIGEMLMSGLTNNGDTSTKILKVSNILRNHF